VNETGVAAIVLYQIRHGNWAGNWGQTTVFTGNWGQTAVFTGNWGQTAVFMRETGDRPRFS